MARRIVLSRGKTRIGWWLAQKVAMNAYSLGVVSGGWAGWSAEGRERGIFVDLSPRPYVLGIERRKWGHILLAFRYRHRYYDVMGMCGRCHPWPCCGSVEYDHAEDCGGDS